MPRSTTSSRSMWKAFCRGALPPRRFACGLQCARSATFPDVKSCRRTLDIPGIFHEEGMRSWVDMAIRSSLRNPFREPCGYIATLRSKVFNNSQTLRSHKQSAERAVRLVQPMATQDMREAMAWGRAFCDGCLVRSEASWHPR